MNIGDFLLARLAEDEEGATSLLRRAQEHELNCTEPRLLGTTIPGWYDWPTVQAVAARVLADCEAKRRIVAWAWDNEEVLEGEWGDGRDRDQLERAGILPDPLRHLAAVYADHPDYQEDWRP